MKIAIIGAGGVGGYLGAKLCNEGHDVFLVARGEHLNAIRRNGLILKSVEGELHVHPDAASDFPSGSSFDYFIVAVKSYDTQDAARLIHRVLTTGSAVLTIQNGVENEDLLTNILGHGTVIGGIAWIYSTIGGPGIIQHLGNPPKFVIGELDGTVGARIHGMETMFNSAGINTSTTDRIRHMLWEKWIFIAAVGGMTAITRKSIGEVLANDTLREDLEAIVREGTRIAAGKTGDNFTDTVERTLGRIRRLPASGTSSMYYDVTHGKRPEADALNGAAVRFGKELGIPVPVNERVYRILMNIR